MDFTPFDTRKYPVLDVRAGYGEWAASYDATVPDEMDLPLLARVAGVDWPSVRHGLDLACGTGRIGAWLKDRGVARLTGVDLTPEMLARAADRGVYETLIEADVTDTGFGGGEFDLVCQSLADEHLPDLAPLYIEVARLLTPGGTFVLVGYHPQFLMQGMAAHFDRAGGESVAVKSYVHLLSDHVKAARAAGLTLLEMDEAVIDDAFLRRKPQWAQYRYRPVSFAMVWRR